VSLTPETGANKPRLINLDGPVVAGRLDVVEWLQCRRVFVNGGVTLKSHEGGTLRPLAYFELTTRRVVPSGSCGLRQEVGISRSSDCTLRSVLCCHCQQRVGIAASSGFLEIVKGYMRTPRLLWRRIEPLQTATLISSDGCTKTKSRCFRTPFSREFAPCEPKRRLHDYCDGRSREEQSPTRGSNKSVRLAEEQRRPMTKQCSSRRTATR